MVWFHGGGFVTGSSAATFYGPGNLLDRDVILVTANYRLGVLGYLTLGKLGEDVDVQGNQGLWDQVEGIQCQIY
jgi:carboxylesterase type B